MAVTFGLNIPGPLVVNKHFLDLVALPPVSHKVQSDRVEGLHWERPRVGIEQHMAAPQGRGALHLWGPDLKARCTFRELTPFDRER